MSKEKHVKKTQLSVDNILYWIVGILLILTMLTIWLVSGLFAKYVISDNRYDSARVASSGIGNLELLEHEAKLENGEYKLQEDKDHEVTKNDYKKVIPGVDIPKDPFIRLKLQNAEVSYELYVKVTENNFPTYTTGSDPVKAVTYELTEDWEKTNTPGVYKYTTAFDSDFNGTIKILKDDKLIVSEHYVGNGQFTLTFSAYLMQSKTN